MQVVTFTADLGQGEELNPAREKAELLGIKPTNIYIEDLREEFVSDFVFPCLGVMPFMRAFIFGNFDCAPFNFKTSC